MRSHSRVRQADAGFTISELAVAMTISFVVLLAGYLLIQMVSTSSNAVQARGIAEDETRLALERMGRELRQAEEVGGSAFYTWAPRDLSFYSDVDRDESPERVRYYVSGAQLVRTVAQPTVIPPVSAASFGVEVVSDSPLVRGLKSDWTGPVFVYWAQSTTTATKVAATAVSQICAVDARLYNGALVGAATSYVDVTTEIRIRSVNSSLESLP